MGSQNNKNPHHFALRYVLNGYKNGSQAMKKSASARP